MTKIQIISGYEMIKTLRKFGFVVVRVKGSHPRLKKIFERCKNFFE